MAEDLSKNVLITIVNSKYKNAPITIFKINVKNKLNSNSSIIKTFAKNIILPILKYFTKYFI